MKNFSGFSLFFQRLLLALLIQCAYSAHCQDQNVADSLTLIYNSGEFPKEDESIILRNLAKYHTDPKDKLLYSEELVKVAESNSDIGFLVDGYIGIGTAFRLMGDIPDALEIFLKASEIASENQLEERLGYIAVNIADTYSIIKNHSLAINYYNKGIEILKEHNDTLTVASALYNLGDELLNYGELDSAVSIFLKTEQLFRDMNNEQGLAYTLGNTGQVYAKLGQFEKAEINLNQAVQKLRELGDFYPISVYTLTLSDIYLVRNQDLKSLEYAEQSLHLAQEYGLKEQISDAFLKLSEIYEKMGLPERSINYLKSHNIYRDSITSIAAVQEMAELRTEFEVAQKQSEVDLLTKEAEIADLRARRQRWIIFGSVLSLVLVAVLG